MSSASQQASGQTRDTAGGSAARFGAKRRVAFLGTGYIADWHAQAIRKVAGVELVAVCDRILPKAEALAAKFGVAKTYGSLEAMLAEEKLDAVHVLLPPNLHFEAARAILEAGVEVFLEKPMCDRAADCDELVRLAAERGLRLGVGHNFLFSKQYEQLRHDVRSGVLGKIDHVTITWHRPLPPTQFGPFDIWMLRDPRNILLEIGSHSAAHLLDLVGEPETMHVHPSNPMDLPTGRKFYRRWQVNAFKGPTAVELRFSFVPGFAEYSIHVRGSLASGTVDFERSTYTRYQHAPKDPDFDVAGMVTGQAKSLRRQARQTLLHYFRSKIDMGARGTPYGATIVRAMDAFYVPAGVPLDARVDGRTGAKVIRLCEEMGALANLPAETPAVKPAPAAAKTGPAPRVLILGGTGFIGKELVRQLVASGQSVRLLVRSTGNLPRNLRVPEVECQVGDLLNRDDVRKAMEGVDSVIHLARSNVKSWADYEKYDVGVTRQLAECALQAGVKRFLYTGTIASYYQGAGAGTITEATPLDQGIARGNAYARAKTESEQLLLKMHREQGLPLVILRPGVVIGRGGSPFHWGVGMWWNDAICQTWGDGRNKLPLVLVEDVAAGLILATEKPGIEGQSFNLVGDPLLSAREYLDELDRSGGFKIQRFYTPISRFYAIDLMKWAVKAAMRFPELRRPRYRDWESRTLVAPFDCSVTKATLNWQPVSDRSELVRQGIEAPVNEFTL
jgi:predicted dehydrogenase/nucleoside-diphosphate-sugar epimerase